MPSTGRLWVAAATASVVALGSCLPGEPTGSQPPLAETTLLVRADLSGTTVATVVVEVTAPDIPPPLVFNIPIAGRVALGTITLPAGSNRTITMRAFDAGGVETHTGSITVSIRAGTNPTIAIIMSPLTGSVPIDATFGSFTVTVQPAAGTLPVDDTVSLTANLLDGNGNSVTGQVEWGTLAPAVATVVRTGLQTARVTARRPGRTTVVATYGGTAGPATIIVAGWYASPGGSSNGDGSSRPWDLPTALSGGHGKVQPGDTIWLRGGTYRGDFTSTLTGTAGNPIVVRGLPGERATIDGRLQVFGANAVYWGLELMQSDPVAMGVDALDASGPSKKFINLVIHDAGAQGFSFYDAGGVSELYGCIIYNNGTHEGLDHGVYAANDAGTKYLRDNIVFNNLAYGIHVYATADHAVLTDVHAEGNVSFNNGAISTAGMAKSNLLMGGDTPTTGMHALNNRLYFVAGATGSNARFGVAGQNNEDVEVRNNYSVGGAIGLQLENWQTATVQNNTWLGTGDMVYLTTSAAPSYTWGGNTWYRDPVAPAWRYQEIPFPFDAWQAITGLGASDQTLLVGPTKQTVFVQANQYEPGRVHIVVYNWSGAATAWVDLSGLLQTGDRYQVHNAQDIFGGPVANGTYDGSPVPVSMAGVDPPVPLGRSTPTPPKTAPFFDVFVLTRTP